MLRLNSLMRVSSFLLLLIFSQYSVALNSDGIFLLKFRYSILSDPLSVFESWNYDDATPCSWNGVACTELGASNTPDFLRVTSLVLPNSQLLGSIAEELGLIQYLHHIDLSNNFLNGSLPNSIFNSSQLQILSLSNNAISGHLTEFIGLSTNLQILNLSTNAFGGSIPQNLTSLHNLTVLSLKGNFFHGEIPNGFNSVQILDLSLNLLNGPLPSNFHGENLQYLNLSNNNFSGTIPQTFAMHIPEKSTIDLSFNNLTGPIPQSIALLNQKPESLSGNTDLCGKPLKILCTIPSTMSNPPQNLTNTSSPAIAAIPRTIDSTPTTNGSSTTTKTTTVSSQNGLKPATIAAIVVGDVAGIAILALIILCVYQQRKKKYPKNENFPSVLETVAKQKPEPVKTNSNPCSSCLTIKQEDPTSSDESDHVTVEDTKVPKDGTLVTVDGETKLDLETLLKASAYILGTKRVSIVYKAVLQDGRVFAVRRIGECCVERLKDFENHVRGIAKIRHPNLVKIFGFCWGEDEKLVISEFVPNGSLSTIGFRRGSSSPMSLSLEVRLKIAKGVARGLAYIHEKKQVHGNVKPSNILLNSEMEPIISDFGLDLLLLNDINHRGNGSFRQLVNQRTPQQQTQEFPIGSNSSSPYATMGSTSTSGGGQVQYQAPESFQNIKPNPKCDVYSFGVVLLELLSGRIFSDRELDQWSVSVGSVGAVEEEKTRVLRMVDVAIKHEIEGRENVVFTCFKLGLNCVSLVPQKRPSIKEALQILEKIPTVDIIN